MGGCMFVVKFCPFNIECNRGLRSMIFYEELVIPVCDSRHSLSLYFLPYPNLIRHHTKTSIIGIKRRRWRVDLNFSWRFIHREKLHHLFPNVRLKTGFNFSCVNINLKVIWQKRKHVDNMLENSRP